MSSVPAVNAVPPPVVPSSAAVSTVAAHATGTAGASSSGYAGQPAVIVSVSAKAAAPAKAASAPLSLNPDNADNALSWASGANVDAYLAAHSGEVYAMELAKFGKATADRNRAATIGSATNGANFAMSYASGLGIPVKQSASPDTAKNGAPLGTISVDAFSFKSGGSTYSVTPGKDGTLVGTKDGQAWRTWQLTASATPHTDFKLVPLALADLHTLNSLQGQQSAGHPLAPLNVRT